MARYSEKHRHAHWDFPEGFPVRDFEICRNRRTRRENLLRFRKLTKSLRQFRIVPFTEMQHLIRRDARKICHYAAII